MTFFSKKTLRLLLLPALLLLTGCAGSSKETADSQENTKLSAVATIFPQYDFLRAIGGDHLDLHMLLSPGAESHSFEPTPGDMIPNVISSSTSAAIPMPGSRQSLILSIPRTKR